jgi:O-antigen/teichoic acid export membrane protein
MAVPIGLAFAMNYVYYRVDLVVLAALRPISDVGQYGVAYRFIDALMMLPSFVMYVLRPVISASFVESAETLRRRYDRCLYVLFLMAAPLAVGGAMTAWRLLPVIPGFERYAGAGVALSVLLPAFSIILVAHLVQSAMVSAHLQRRLLSVSAVGLGLNLAATVVLVLLFSYIGAAVATLITELAVAVLSAEILRRHTGLARLPEGWSRVALLTAFVAVVLALSYPLPAIAQAALGVVAFAAGLPLLGALTPDDLRALGLRAPRLWPPALVPAIRR